MRTSLDLIQDSLALLGVSENASKLYVYCYIDGPRKIAEIVKKIECARPNVYKLIDELKDLKLVEYKKIGAEKCVYINSPGQIEQLLRERKDKQADEYEAFVSVLPTIFETFKQLSSPALVQTYYTKEKIIEIFDMTLNEETKNLKFLGSIEDIVQFISWEYDLTWIKRRVEKNIKFQVLSTDTHSDEHVSELKMKNKEELREIRFFKDTTTFNTSFILFGNKIVFFQPITPIAILIEDQYLVTMFQQLFDVLWRDAL